jgi:hypothetical protein
MPSGGGAPISAQLSPRSPRHRRDFGEVAPLRAAGRPAPGGGPGGGSGPGRNRCKRHDVSLMGPFSTGRQPFLWLTTSRGAWSGASRITWWSSTLVWIRMNCAAARCVARRVFMRDDAGCAAGLSAQRRPRVLPRGRARPGPVPHHRGQVPLACPHYEGYNYLPIHSPSGARSAPANFSIRRGATAAAIASRTPRVWM